METNLNLKNINKSFEFKEVLKNISLNFESGKIYGILGNNGVGKTTLVKIIFQELNFDSGSITFMGSDIKNINFNSWYFFPENEDLPKDIEVDKYLLYVKNLAQISKNEFNKRYEEINKFLNIDKFKNQKIQSLSSGQKKLVSIFLCLLLKPKVIFFDEPTANIDVNNKKFILEAIESLKDKDTIIVIITHLIEEIKNILGHIIILDNGNITYDNKYNKNESIEDIFKKYTTKNIDIKNETKRYLKNETNI